MIRIKIKILSMAIATLIMAKITNDTNNSDNNKR